MTFDRFEEMDNDSASNQFGRGERGKIQYGNSRRPTRRNKPTRRSSGAINGIHRRSNKRAAR